MNFEALWREAGQRESSETKVRLGCNGELVGLGYIELAGAKSALGDELIEFVCPRCNQRHVSPRVR